MDPNQPQTTPSPASGPVPIPQPKQSPPVFLILLALALLASTGYLGYKNYILEQTISQLTEGPAPTASPQPSAPEDDLTASWELYSNEGLGISFRVSRLQDVVVNGNIIDVSKSKTAGPIIKMGAFYDPNNLTPCDLTKEVNQSICMSDGKSQGQSQNVEEYSLGEKEAISFYLWETQGNSIFKIIQLKDGSFSIAHAIDGVGMAKRFNQILSTFEFTE